MVGSFLTGLFASLDVNEGGANGAFFGNPKLLGYQVFFSFFLFSLPLSLSIFSFKMINNDTIVPGHRGDDRGVGDGDGIDSLLPQSLSRPRPRSRRGGPGP